MGVIELLRKYAADAAEAPKFNFKHIPMVGDRIAGYEGASGAGVVDDAYLDAWWKAYDETNADNQSRLRRENVDRLAREMQSHWQGELEKSKNKHWWNIGDVSSKWLAQQAGIGKNELKYMAGATSDELKDLEWRIRNKTLFNETRGKALRKTDRKLTAAEHVTGQVLSGATLGLGADWYTKKTTGESIDELARTYGNIYAQDYGAEAARRAENWLRLGGHVGKFVGELPWMLAGNAAVNGIKNGLFRLPGFDVASRAARISSKFWPKLGLSTLAGLERAAAGYIGAGRLWYPVSDVMHAAGYLSSNLGADKAAGGLHWLGGFADKIPAGWAANTGMSSFVGAWNIPVYSRVARYADRLDQAIKAGNMGLARRAATGFMRYAAWDFSGGLASFTVRGVRSLYNGAPVDFVALAGDLPADLAESLEQPLRGISWYGSIATPDSGAALMHSIREQPDKVAAELTEAAYDEGIPVVYDPNDLTDEDYMQAFRIASTKSSREVIMRGAIKALLPQSELDRISAMPDDQANAELERLMSAIPKEKVASAMFPNMKMAIQGGHQLDVWAWSMASPDQRRELIELSVAKHVTGRHGTNDATGREPGTWSRLSKLFGSTMDRLSEGDKQLFVDAINDPVQYDNIFNGMTAQVRGVLSGESHTHNADDAEYLNAFVGALDNEKVQDFSDAVLKGMSAEQLGSAMNNAVGAAIPQRMVQALGKTLAARVHEEVGFAEDFVPVFAGAIANGTGVTGQGRDIAISALKNMDVKSMKPEQAFGLARALLSISGEGGQLDGELKVQADRLSEDLKQVTQAAWQKDPLKWTPAMVSLFAQKNGYGGIASWLQNPLAFWAAAAGLVFGLLWLGKSLLGGDDDDDDDDDDKSKEPDAMSLMRMRRDRMAADTGFALR